MAGKVGWTLRPRAVKPAAAGRSPASALRGLEAGGWLVRSLEELRTKSDGKNSYLIPWLWHLFSCGRGRSLRAVRRLARRKQECPGDR